MPRVQRVFCLVAVWCLKRAGYHDVVFVPVVNILPHPNGAVAMQAQVIAPTFIHATQPTPVGPFGGFLH